MSVTLKSITFSYAQSDKVLEGLNFIWGHNEVVGILGANGSGKTTLANILRGALHPQEGTIQITDKAGVLQTDRSAINRHIAYIGPDPENQLLTSTVIDELAFSLQAAHLPRNVMQARLDNTISQFDLEPLLPIHPFQLSVGQKYRVLLAAVAIMQPRYLVLDEVFAMLDSNNRARLTTFLTDLRQREGTSIAVISHRLEDLVIANTIHVLNTGRFIFSGSLANLLDERDILTHAHIIPPKLFLLLGALTVHAQAEIVERYPQYDDLMSYLQLR